MSTRLDNLKTYRDALEEAYYRGIKTVTVDGVNTTFQNGADMRTAIRNVNREIGRLEGFSTRPAVSSIDLSGF